MSPLRVLEHFADLPEPRVARSRRHCLHEMLVIAFLAVLCGAEGWDDIERFGIARMEWLRERLDLALEGGIPSDDTFRRLFARLDPEAFGRCFRAWVQTIQAACKGEVIALDGKKLRHSFDTACGQEALCMVRAWATKQRLVLGAVKVADGSNEIPAVTSLLSLLDVRDAIVTADALHCQRETAKQVIEQGGDYLFTVKDNQRHLAEDIRLCFEHLNRHPAAAKEWQEAASGRRVDSYSGSDFGHGRSEMRSVQVLNLAPGDPDWRERQDQWKGLRALVKIERTRRVHGTASKETRETHYYITSLRPTARQTGAYVRHHWRIENSLHWVLDVGMNEDDCRIRIDHAPENFALLRSVALNLLRRDTQTYGGMRARQKLAGWNPDYLLKLIA